MRKSDKEVLKLKLELMGDPTLKDWTEDWPDENGTYQRWCEYCQSYFRGHKRRVICKQCYGEQGTGL